MSFIKSKPNCDLSELLVDEYNTSKVCAKYHRRFDDQYRLQFERKGYRYCVSKNCKPNDRVLGLPPKFTTPKANRVYQSEMKDNRLTGRKNENVDKKSVFTKQVHSRMRFYTKVTFYTKVSFFYRIPKLKLKKNNNA